MNSYSSKVMQSFLSLTHYTFIIWLGTDAMASKDTQIRLIKKKTYKPRDLNVLDVRRTVSTRSHLSDLKCQIFYSRNTFH